MCIRDRKKFDGFQQLATIADLDKQYRQFQQLVARCGAWGDEKPENLFEGVNFDSDADESEPNNEDAIQEVPEIETGGLAEPGGKKRRTS